MSGVGEPSAGTLRVRGLAAVLIAGVAGAMVVVNPFAGDDPTARFTIVTPAVPDGIQDGVPVDLRGETVGTVCGLDISDRAVTRMDVCVDDVSIGKLTVDSQVSFVSRNLFGSDAVRLAPTTSGAPLSSGDTIVMATPPSDHTITAAVRSAGAFTLPVLTPELTELLNDVSDTTIRMTPFLTTATLALQTLQQADVAPVRTLLPTTADAVDGVGEAGAGAVTALETLVNTDDLLDRPYVARVHSMIGDIGTLFSGLGLLFTGAGPLASVLDMVTSVTTPLGGALSGVTPEQVGTLIDRFGGVFQTDATTGRTTVSVSANLDVVPGVSTPLNLIAARVGAGS
ncbi:MlaD family protein [Rhodococcus triatomae]